jgi:hypothetical protein
LMQDFPAVLIFSWVFLTDHPHSQLGNL